ncbi:GmrSD restriction endonuclease domain-containing protein [Capnocytophaga canimorsus]|uniref:GmrSD restriction endonuclease domain-containing protein n=1 Tax=Capnocytophaga canimorsus TaxID=28188 RepID=UPI0037CFE9B3
MAIWKTYRVADVITEIDEEKFVLPVIQRPLVWTEDKMELLFDTLLKGDSFGGVMTIEEEKDTKPLFNYRPFTKDGNFISSRQIDSLKQQQFFVIDGQQRLQTFYIGLKGSINGKVLYFDLFSDYNLEYEFKFEKDENKLPKISKENIDRKIPEHYWYPTKELLKRLKDTNDEDQVASEIISLESITDETKKMYITKNVKAFYKNIITAETLGISKVVINKSLPEIENRQRIVELFRRLNDGGTRLSSFDLVASILKGFSWEMEGFLKEILEKYQDIGLTQDNLIKLIFLLQDNHNKEMASIEATDAEFAIKNRERIKATIKALKDFLECSKTLDYYKEGNRSFIPLFFISYHLFHKDIDNNALMNYFNNYDTGNSDFPLMKCWLYHSLINGVFRSKGAGWIPYKTGIRKILEAIKTHKNEVFPIEELFQVYTNHPITFTRTYTSSNLDQLDSSFVYYLMYDRARTIRTNDVDHIMPKNILETNGIDSSKINSIKNFQLLDFGTNRGAKNGKPFKEWVDNQEFVKDKPAYVLLHLIPSDETLWIEDKFENFIETRAKLILSKLESYIN